MRKNVITEVVYNDLCVGCGICALVCPINNLKIEFDNQGKYVPKNLNTCPDDCDLCLKSCPSKCKILYKDRENASVNSDEFIGQYYNLYTGYVKQDKIRHKASTGGITRFLLSKLLKENIVDYVIHVAPNDDPEKLFKFCITSNPEEVEQTSKSAYYPVEMSEVLDYVESNEGRYAITALPCFAKGLRLAQETNSKLKERIKFIFGLTCGQMKTKHYAWYLSFKAGLNLYDYVNNADFRCKLDDQSSCRSLFSLSRNRKHLEIHYLDGIDSVWENRWFTPNACNYCDDIFAEFADISFGETYFPEDMHTIKISKIGDNYLPEESEDKRGSNIVISRNELLDNLLKQAVQDNEIVLSTTVPEKIIETQQEIIEFKRKQLAWRLYDDSKRRESIPETRVSLKKTKIFQADYLIMRLKEQIRKKSFKYFPQICQNSRSILEMRLYEFLIRLIGSIKRN